MRQVKKRLFAAALSLAMLFSLFPASVFADEAEAAQELSEAEAAQELDADGISGAEAADAEAVAALLAEGAQYVLMNIPYADFYAAELDGGAVDAVTQATLKFENKSVAAGSYHVNDSARFC